MKKNINLTIIIAFFITLNAKAQFEINNSGMVQITANTQDWQSGLKIILPTYNSCAYHLNWNGKDRIYQLANGYIAAEKGFWTFSDINLKENIVTINDALNKVKQLRGVYFNYKSQTLCSTCDSTTIVENDLSRQMGVIAQEVEAVIPEVVRDQYTGYKAVAYQHLVGLLIEAVKEQQKKIDTQAVQIQQLKQEITDLKGKTVYTDVDKTKLYQNDPNPFKGVTTITYFIDENVTIINAVIEIRNMMGILQTTVSLGDRSGLGKVQFDGSILSDGYYVYSLKLNGSLKDSKMLLIGE